MATFTSKKEIVTRLQKQIESKDSTAIHALLFIYGKQTEDEKASEETLHNNGMGFKGKGEAKFYSRLAAQYLSQGFLSPKQIECVKKAMRKYAGQIVAFKLEEGEIKKIKRGSYVW